MEPVSTILAMSALLAAAVSDTDAVRVSVMGDRAEELGYARPVGLTPAWGVPNHRMGVWNQWKFSDLNSSRVPDHLPWMKQHQWKRILQSLAAKTMSELAIPYASSVGASEYRNTFAESLAVYADWVSGRATDIDADRAAQALYEVWFHTHANYDYASHRAIDILFSAFQRPQGGHSEATCAESTIGALGLIKRRRNPLQMDAYVSGLRENYFRSLAEQIDAIAPWSM